MAKSYHDLTSSDEPDIFDISPEQKHILNQLIHFASINRKEFKTWYQEHCRSTVNKNSSDCYVQWLWKKLKLSAYSIDYVQNIWDDNNKTQDGYAPLAVQKNNWLHPNTGLFSKYLGKHPDFGFLLALNFYRIICLTNPS